jgi:hypothetical protein
MSKSGESLLRGAREALAYVRRARQGFVANAPKQEALFVEELSDAELEAIGRVKVPPEHDNLDLEDES